MTPMRGFPLVSLIPPSPEAICVPKTKINAVVRLLNINERNRTAKALSPNQSIQ